jgi:type 1 glutamine amidotransferase/nicotinamidase-related amidase
MAMSLQNSVGGFDRRFAAAGLLVLLFSTASATRGDEVTLSFNLTLRSRVDAPGYGAYRVVETRKSWNTDETAIIICDMWDLHHCLNATRRVNELAPRINDLLGEKRVGPMVVIHAPSSCMDAYKDHPARLRALSTPRSKKLPPDIGQWCKRIPSEEQAHYPVDQTDGGEDDDPAEHASWAARLKAMGRNPSAPWKKQTDAIAIDPKHDYISDNGEEIWSILEARGIKNVMLVGVHLNMCVLGRPFGLRQMAKNGMNVVLIRDLTDTMYNPKRAPFLSHFSGTDRVIEHVERFVCPTTTSDELLNTPPLRFKDDHRPRIAFLIADDEYKTASTLPAFAARHLARDYQTNFIFDRADDKNALTGLSTLKDADVLVVSARRRVFPKDQLDAVRQFVASGKGVVGLRTASHAFSPRGNEAVPEGHDAWPEFDADVLGGHYVGHHGPGSSVVVVAAGGGTKHPVLHGIEPSALVGHGTLYKVNPLKSSTTALLLGSIPGQPPEPVAWTNLTTSGGRVVYTSLGHPDDFSEPAFQRFLRNAIAWTLKQEVPQDGSGEFDRVSTPVAIPFPK